MAKRIKEKRRISRHKYGEITTLFYDPKKKKKIRSGRNITRVVGKSRYNRKETYFFFFFSSRKIIFFFVCVFTWRREPSVCVCEVVKLDSRVHFSLALRSRSLVPS